MKHTHTHTHSKENGVNYEQRRTKPNVFTGNTHMKWKKNQKINKLINKMKTNKVIYNAYYCIETKLKLYRVYTQTNTNTHIYI